MNWMNYWLCGVICLLASVVLAVIRGKTKYKRGRMIDPLKILFAGVILSSVILFIPIYLHAFQESDCGMFETFFIAIHNMIRLFIVDGDFEFIAANISGLSGWLYHAYSGLFAILFVMAPLLTFGFVLSFFKSVSAYKRYFTHYRSDVYIFSELNDKSLALARSLYENRPKGRFFVFTDVFEKDEEQSYEMIEKAKELGAICFKKDIVTVNFTFHSKNSKLNFFAIGEDHTENIDQALKLISTFKYRENTNLFVFSTQVEAEMLLAKAFNEKKSDDQAQSMLPIKIRVRRVNEVQSLINRNLYEVGYEKIFRSAYQEEDGIRNISAVVIGMGQHGTEMTKALSWFCQMDGYRAEINAFDMDENAEEQFKSLCPELMDDQHNDKFEIAGEAKYKITIYSGYDIHTKRFDDAIMALKRATYVFVALGNDEKNISTAIKLRSLFARMGCMPQIQAVIYNTDKKDALAGITNYRGQEYQIDFIGDLESSYSEAVIIDSDVEAEALKRHLKWGEEEAFWKYGYNYSSSIASAIHRKMKIACKIPGADKAVEDRTEEEKQTLRILEHCRWNAYMRSEGYVYSGNSQDKTSRNDMAKMHHCLVPFEELLEEEKVKDDD